MEREAKAKVVASVGGGRIYSISYHASCFASVDVQEKVYFIQIDRGKIVIEYLNSGSGTKDQVEFIDAIQKYF